MTAHSWPVKLTFSRSARSLRIAFDDDSVFDLPYTVLRLNSPSAEVQGHGAGPKPPPPILAEDLSIDKAEPVGRYAVRMFFSDGHSSGLFTWPYLRELGENEAAAD
ncbi:MAG: DUF971 domain-containing protein [Pseudomonadota bacterium]